MFRSLRGDDVFFRFLRDSVSDGVDMNVDGSSVPVNFDVAVPPGDKGEIYITRLCGMIVDGNQTPTKFGGRSGLANGLRAVVVDGSGNELCDFLDGKAIKKNADWILLAGSDGSVINAVAGDDIFKIRWAIAKGLARPLRLSGGEKFRLIVRDDLTDLTEFRFVAQGKR